MSFYRCAGIAIMSIIMISNISSAATPAGAQVGSFNQQTKKETKPRKTELDKLIFDAPVKPWRIPPRPLNVNGEGISIYYLVPFKRVADLIPPSLKPYPGPEEIYLRIDCINWKSLTAKNKENVEKKVKPFLELDYRFEVTKDGQRGTFPIRMHMNKKYAVLWSRHYGHYPAYRVNVAYVNFSPHIHLFQFRNDEFPLAAVEANPDLGFKLSMNNLFNRRQDTALWAGQGIDYVLDEKTGKIKALHRKFNVELKSGVLNTLLIREPVKWKLLTKEEVKQPVRIFILESITGQWLGD